MLALSLLVIQVGYYSFIWFFSFSILFFLLGYKMTFYIIKIFFVKIFRIKAKTSTNNEWIDLNHENIIYNEGFKEIKLNDKLYRYSQVKSIDLFVNNKKIELEELKKIKNIKTLEIKIGIKVNKITYKKFKYITNKDNDKLKKKQLKNALSDYEKLNKIVNIKKKEKKNKKIINNKAQVTI